MLPEMQQSYWLLENLSFSDQSVIQIANANYFKHLLQHLYTGPDDVNMVMITLAEMELTDHIRESLFDVVYWLLFSHYDLQVKTVADIALRSLYILKKNGLVIIRQGAARLLLDLLFHPSIQTSSLWEDVVAVIMQLAASTISQLSPSVSYIWTKLNEITQWILDAMQCHSC